MTTWVWIAGALVCNGLAGLAGGLLSDVWVGRHLPGLVSFAAGALIAAVFLDVLPEAVDSAGPVAWPCALGGYVALGLFEWAMGAGHVHEAEVRRPVLPAALLASDALHNLGDGAALAAAFLASPGTGIALAVAIIAHEVPQEIGDFALLRAAGVPRGRALMALAAVQLTSAVGAAGVWLAAGLVVRGAGVVMAVAAGSFLYIGASDLVPEIHQGRLPRDRAERVLGFLVGVGVLSAVRAVAS